MYDGAGDIEDEVRQNARDQQHPVVRWEVADTQPMEIVRPELIVKPVLGLNQRQNNLINNVDEPQAEEGAARERRLEIVYKDITSIIRFLPKIQDVREYLSTMPHNEDEDLIEALAMADLQLKKLIAEVVAKLQSLELELNLKKVAV